MLVKQTSVGDAVLLILALCFHSVFEGIAIGVAGKSFGIFVVCQKFQTF